MTPSRDAPNLPITPIDGVSLEAYVDICRALVRDGGDSPRRIEAVLASHGVNPAAWTALHEAWTERIRRDPAVRSPFQRLYAGKPTPDAGGNE